MLKKKRAAELAWAQGLAETPDMAGRLIMSGRVYRALEKSPGNFARVEKPGDLLPLDTRLELKGKDPFVSRGAYKLRTAIERFSVKVQGLVALDAGASTGGFTDYLLQQGVAKVYAVDVGQNQLHEKLKADARVISLESVNLRFAGPELLPERVDLVVADLSFISLRSILPACVQFLKPGGDVIALIKPQFEVPPAKGIKGVVRDEAARSAAVDGVLTFAREKLGLELMGCTPAAIKGPKGNQEYLAYWNYPSSPK